MTGRWCKWHWFNHIVPILPSVVKHDNGQFQRWFTLIFALKLEYLGDLAEIIHPGNPRCSKKVSSNESRWFLVFSAKSRNLLFSRIPYTNPLWVLCAIFPELRCAFGPLVGCPLILVKTEKMKKMWKKGEKVPYFSVCGARIRVHPMLCAPLIVGFWMVLGCWLMLV